MNKVKSKNDDAITCSSSDVTQKINEIDENNVQCGLFIPKKVEIVSAVKNRCKFVFSPLNSGFGVTVGNALRRVLLSYIKGYSIYAIEIPGVKHEFSSIKGVYEDVVDIVLNLKKICFKKIGDCDNEKISVKINSNVFKGNDINKFSKNFTVINEDFEICHFSETMNFEIVLHVNSGFGFEVAKKNVEGKIGLIYIDSIYSPVRNVSFDVVDKRIGDKIGYNELTIDVETNGVITPCEAVMEGANVLIDHFKIFADSSRLIAKEKENDTIALNIEMRKMKRLLMESIDNLKFTTRSANCLRCAGVEYVKDLVKMSKDEVLGIKNLGGKSIKEIEEFLNEKDLSFGMDIAKYGLL